MPPTPDNEVTLAELSRRDGRTAVDSAISKGLAVVAGLGILISGMIIYALVRDTAGFLTGADLSSLWGDTWRPRNDQFGLRAPLTGTLWVVLIAVLIAGPVGLGAAIYLSEYANPRIRRVIKPIIEVLASIPSVVLGFFAVNFIAPDLVQRVFSDANRQNLLVAGLGVGLLCIPLMTSVTEDALRAVPNGLREASYGIGARKITTVLRVVVPAAVSGMVAALILTISRAIGETMVVFLAAGGQPTSASSPLDPGMTITSAMTGVLTGSDQQSGTAQAQSVYFLGMLLFLGTLSLNLIADRFVRRVRTAI